MLSNISPLFTAFFMRSLCPLDCLREGYDTRGHCGFLFFFVRRLLLLRHEPREMWM